MNSLSVITGFVDELTLKIGAPVMVTNNIDTSDGITNGTLGTLAQVIKNSKNEIHYLVIDLGNPSKGQSFTWQNPIELFTI